MGERTGIGWTDRTWNAWHGCTRVSPGCAKCYMFRDKKRYGQDPTVVVRSKTTFDAPLKWRERARVFTCSWSDFFHEAADAWRPEAWDIIRKTPHLTYQILTKRPERIWDHLPPDWGKGYPNVWLGVSVENQRFVKRTMELLGVPAVVHFVSVEPLLGPIRFTFKVATEDWTADVLTGAAYRRMGRGEIEYEMAHRVDWVIVGGESGPDGVRRDMKLEWLESVVRQCDEARVPVFVKQDSGPRDSQQGRIPDHLWARKEFPR
jgi:protein gp37